MAITEFFRAVVRCIPVVHTHFEVLRFLRLSDSSGNEQEAEHEWSVEVEHHISIRDDLGVKVCSPVFQECSIESKHVKPFGWSFSAASPALLSIQSRG
jgi:hypothetical protein